MSLLQHQQFYQLIQRSKTPLIVFPQNHNVDAIVAGLALSRLIKKIGQPATVVCQNFQLPTNLSFLTATEEIKSQAEDFKKFIININLPTNDAPTIEHIVNGNRVEIHIAPTQHELSEEHFDSVARRYKHDLVIALNASTMETLGDLYETHPDFFFQTPIINFDHSIENEHYGHLNIVNIAATSVSEIIFELIEQLDANLMDETMATYLLTGMIDKTRSFKIPTVTPKTLNIAGRLIAAGGQRATIIKNLYQTKTVKALKLWGRVLLHLQTDEMQRVAWAEITDEDFIETQTAGDDLTGVIDELIANIPTVELTALFFPKDNGRHCLIKSEKNYDLLATFNTERPSGDKKLIKFQMNAPTESVVDRLKQMTDYNLYI
ncbi:MAG: hypothetical protein V1763_01310 [Parcubacteria group bacterium]